MIMKKLLAATCTLAMMGTAATAATVTFEPDENGFPGFQFVSVPSGGVSDVEVAGVGDLSIDGQVFTTAGGGNINVFGAARITQDAEGLGINSIGPDPSDVDGGGVINDIIVFAFDRDVRLANVIFENVDNNDDFVFYVPTDNPNAGEFDIVNPFADNPDGDAVADEGIFNFGNRVVSTFGIGARGSFDNFRVSRIEVTDVPLPASALLLLAGVGGLAAMRRKKS